MANRVVDNRSVGSFATSTSKKRYWVVMGVLLVVALTCGAGLLAYNNPMEFGSRGYWLIAQRRLTAVTAMAIVAVCQGFATVAFQTITNNRILTPSIMGFESLYVAIHTATIYFFGVSGLLQGRTTSMFVLQVALMIGLSLVLYSWLLSNSEANLHAMLLVGIVLGGGLASVSTFMQRMLTPSDFDVLTARLFGSVNNADPSYYPIALPLVAAAVVLILQRSRYLNVLGLGRNAAMNLGVSFRGNAIYILVLVAVLMAVSTALVGPMTFLGFLVATLTYQFADTYDHRYLLPMAALMGFCILTSAYFLMNHVFYAQGVVSIIIELVGGLTFLVVILRKGRL